MFELEIEVRERKRGGPVGSGSAGSRVREGGGRALGQRRGGWAGLLCPAGWAEGGVGLGCWVFYFPFPFLYLLQTKFEFKSRFEFKPHSK